jgi:hypothetical protein
MSTELSKEKGLLLVDFVNADSSEDAVLALLSNLQRHFSFSAEFYELAKNLYPSINVIAALLSQADKQLLEQIQKKNAIISKANERFKSINYAIENYDPLSKTVSLTSLDWNRDNHSGISQGNQITPDEPGDGGFLETLKLLGLSIVDGPITINIDVVKSEIDALLGPQAADQLNQLAEVGFVIEDLFPEFNAQRYQELHSLADEQGAVINFHSKIRDLQTDYRQTMEMIIAGKSYSEIPAIATCLQIYNDAGLHRLTLGNNNCLHPVAPIEENRYLAIKEIEGWFSVLKEDLAYCLIEFLKLEKSRSYLKKCPACSHYFIARQPRIQKFCQKKCRLTFTKRNQRPPA